MVVFSTFQQPHTVTMNTCKCNNYIVGKPYTATQCRTCWENANAPKRTPLKIFNRCKFWTGTKQDLKVDPDGNRKVDTGCECRTVYSCGIHTNVVVAATIPGMTQCVCNDFESKIATAKPFTYADAVVSIGHYNMPCTVEFHIKSINNNCGSVPVIVTDDFTELAYNTDETKGRVVLKASALESKQRLAGICATHNVPLMTSGVNRMGHVGGDLAAFYNGMVYAKEIGARYMIKLSQRFFVDKHLWVQKMVHFMDRENADLMTNEHESKNGILVFPIRSEFMVMRVSKFGSDAILQHLYPRRMQGMAGEIHMTAVVQMAQGKTISCPMFTANRGRKHPGLVWYEQPDARDAYIEAYKKYNVEMSDGFHLQYAPASVNWIG